MYGTLGHTMTQSVISLNIGTLNVKKKKKNKNKNKNLKIILKVKGS